MYKIGIAVIFVFLFSLSTAASAATLDLPGELISTNNKENSTVTLTTRFTDMGRIAQYDTGWGAAHVEMNGVENAIYYHVGNRLSVSAAKMDYTLDGSFAGASDRTRAEATTFTIEKIIPISLATPERSRHFLGLTYKYINPNTASNGHIFSLWSAASLLPHYRLTYGANYYDIPGVSSRAGVFLNVATPLDNIFPLHRNDSNDLFIEYASRDYYKTFIEHVATANATPIIGSFTTANESHDSINIGANLRIRSMNFKFSIYDIEETRAPVLDIKLDL